MNILVTGGLGFIGSFLVERLVSLGHRIDVVDDLSTGSEEWKLNDNHVSYYIMGVNEFCDNNLGKKNYDIIYHLANNARISMSFDFPKETLLNNYNSTVSILEYIRRNNLNCKFYFASSSTTEFTDKFNNPYTFSKFTCDDLLELYKIHYNLNYSILKFYNVYGSNREKDLGDYTTIIRKFKLLYLNNKPLTVYGPNKKRDFTYIDDTIDALIFILNENLNRPVYHIGTGINYTIQEIADAFDHKIEYQLDKRLYELNTTLSSPNILGWQSKQNVIEYIKNWRKNNAIS